MVICPLAVNAATVKADLTQNQKYCNKDLDKIIYLCYNDIVKRGVNMEQNKRKHSPTDDFAKAWRERNTLCANKSISNIKK